MAAERMSQPEPPEVETWELRICRECGRMEANTPVIRPVLHMNKCSRRAMKVEVVQVVKLAALRAEQKERQREREARERAERERDERKVAADSYRGWSDAYLKAGREIVATCEGLLAERDSLREAAIVLTRKLEQAERRLDEAVKALRFYADEENYDGWAPVHCDGACEYDKGRIARKFLASIEATGP